MRLFDNYVTDRMELKRADTEYGGVGRAFGSQRVQQKTMTRVVACVILGCELGKHRIKCNSPCGLAGTGLSASMKFKVRA